MAHSLSHYYSSAKGSLAGINPVEMTELGEDWLIAGAAGAAIGLMSAAKNGVLDVKLAGMTIPLDGLFAVGLGGAGLALHSKELRTASIAAGGAASARVFTGFFKKGLAAHGEIEENPQLAAGYGAEYGWGADADHDRLVQAAKYL